MEIPKRRFALEEKDLSVEADENNKVATFFKYCRFFVLALFCLQWRRFRPPTAGSDNKCRKKA